MAFAWHSLTMKGYLHLQPCRSSYFISCSTVDSEANRFTFSSIFQLDYRTQRRGGESSTPIQSIITSDLYWGGIPRESEEVMEFIRTNKLTHLVQESKHTSSNKTHIIKLYYTICLLRFWGLHENYEFQSKNLRIGQKLQEAGECEHGWVSDEFFVANLRESRAHGGLQRHFLHGARSRPRKLYRSDAGIPCV
jgi:hypothetical protein